jgi:hypothetical protein
MDKDRSGFIDPYELKDVLLTAFNIQASKLTTCGLPLLQLRLRLRIRPLLRLPLLSCQNNVFINLDSPVTSMNVYPLSP